MKPLYEEFLKGAAEWNFDLDKKIKYQLVFHSYAEDSDGNVLSHGTWCYYLIIPKAMYPNDWDRISRSSTYDDLPWHHGITYYQIHDEGRASEYVKVGCDYNHYWDMERGYPDTFESIKVDAEHCASEFLKYEPNYNLRCIWSGKWDSVDKFYLANNGNMIHIDSEKKASKFSESYKRRVE